MIKIIILTSDQIRHRFFRISLSNHKNIKILKTFSEKKQGLGFNYDLNRLKNDIKSLHIFKRDVIENDFFSNKNKILNDKSNNIFCSKGYSSTPQCLKSINRLQPDLIIVYGTSIIRGDILNKYKNRIINVHLGLSPYYRGAATNFFAFSDDNLQCVGSTFMYIDKGIDTGNIIHQIRAKMNYGDSFHQICTRLIVDSIEELKDLILNYKKIKLKKIKNNKGSVNLYYKRSDFSKVSLKNFYKRFEKKLNYYLDNKKKIDQKYKIIKQQFIK
ncbi:formyltransferase family protein [Candidatus Pelagibacter sp.]|nr:formyltransferase family protein [Candidatus Pelagibacter sp.]